MSTPMNVYLYTDLQYPAFSVVTLWKEQSEEMNWQKSFDFALLQRGLGGAYLILFRGYVIFYRLWDIK